MQFRGQRLAYFQPYKTIFEHGVVVCGGSDHMQKIESARWTDRPLHQEQSISRQQAIQLDTINCAYLTFEETEKGSLEAVKLADFIILNKDILTCPVDDIKQIEVPPTYLGASWSTSAHSGPGNKHVS